MNALCVLLAANGFLYYKIWRIIQTMAKSQAELDADIALLLKGVGDISAASLALVTAYGSVKAQVPKDTDLSVEDQQVNDALATLNSTTAKLTAALAPGAVPAPVVDPTPVTSADPGTAAPPVVDPTAPTSSVPPVTPTPDPAVAEPSPAASVPDAPLPPAS